jgi:hypothetical protein
VGGCRQEVETQSTPHHHRHTTAPSQRHRDLRQHMSDTGNHNRGSSHGSTHARVQVTADAGRQALYERTSTNVGARESNSTWQAGWEVGPTDLMAMTGSSARRILRDGNYESDPRPDMGQVGVPLCRTGVQLERCWLAANRTSCNAAVIQQPDQTMMFTTLPVT